MKKKLIPVVTLVAARGMVGCEMKSEASLAQLQQSNWQLEGASADAFTLALVDGKLVGKAGCNRYFAGATSPKNGVLTLSDFGSTRMACEPEAMQKESEFLQTLQKVGTFSIEGKKLILSDANKKALLMFNALAAPAAGEPATLEATPADSTQPAANPPADKVAPHPAAPTQPATVVEEAVAEPAAAAPTEAAQPAPAAQSAPEQK